MKALVRARQAVLLLLILSIGAGIVHDYSRPCEGVLQDGRCDRAFDAVITDDVVYGDQYQIPQAVTINRLQPADSRIPVGENVTLEANVTNTANETIHFTPRVYAYDKRTDFIRFIDQVNVTLQPNETVHREITLERARKPADLRLGFDGLSNPNVVGHVTVYNSTNSSTNPDDLE